MNILVTGANGQLGNEMRLLAAREAASQFRFIFTDVTEASEEAVAMLRKLAGGAPLDTSTRRLDITDLEAIRALVHDGHIDAIVNCAAFTNVDAAEERAELAELLNAKAPENLAVAMKEAGGLLVHISTDYVFGGDPYNTPCREDQTGTPTGVYGLTKLHGEQAIARVGCKHIILRTAWLYSEFGKNFVRTMLNLTATRPRLNVVFDQVGTPTYAGDLATAIFAILTAGPKESGIFHYSNEGVCSWFDFTKSIAGMADQISPDGNRLACDIQPCHSDEFPSPVKRPAYSVLDKSKIKQTFGLQVPYWTDSLRKCLSALL
jgi:dTDP-4-dehydrorhamnose reductase